MNRRGVIIIGPAWHSCGSYQVFKAQIDSYMAMGNETYFLAVSPTMQIIGNGNGYWDYYRRMTPDIRATVRGEARLGIASRVWPIFGLVGIEAKRRTTSFWRTMPARLAKLPDSLHQFISSHEINVIHCNHFFNLPIAKKMKEWTNGASVICETHDIQSRHFIISDPLHPLTKSAGDYNSYFRDELRCCGDADEFVHLNDQEYEIFQRELPGKKHHLIYPSVQRPPKPPKSRPDIDFLIFASCNLPNYQSLCWFLDEVWDEKLNAAASLRIVGNIDYMFQDKSDERYTRYRDAFVSRVEDVVPWYHRARTVLAPVTEGHGIAIKTIEALSYGCPFLFSPLAIRGFDYRPEVKKLTGMCKTADEFKNALWARLSKKSKKPVRESNKAAIEVYESLFTPEIYQRNLGKLFAP